MNEIASRPDRERATAAAAMLPSTSDTIVAEIATCTESQNASHIAGLSLATPNHFVVRPGGGNVGTTSSVVNVVEDDEAEREPEEQDAESDRTLQHEMS